MTSDIDNWNCTRQADRFGKRIWTYGLSRRARRADRFALVTFCSVIATQATPIGRMLAIGSVTCTRPTEPSRCRISSAKATHSQVIRNRKIATTYLANRIRPLQSSLSTMEAQTQHCWMHFAFTCGPRARVDPNSGSKRSMADAEGSQRSAIARSVSAPFY